ncbi:helix-turn-helix domain-containing protein [Cohnella zeiphila]|uniref:AraC family transcriptional regulator n=1 Tax=Cohnella zeiphila TaxID=2761120 RepID=A0A7X0VYA1_9BACL|nr:AraC family transcriptional regulator [Cohnella zeiphila]MBB6734272.1 AraC family transcriptional regulator [Cohnella zeiphila]
MPNVDANAVFPPVIRVLGDFVMKPGSGLGERDIPDCELLYFPEGTESVYQVGGREFSLDRPCFVVTRPGEVHSYRYDKQRPTRHLFVHFRPRPLDEAEAALPLLHPDGPSVVPYDGDFLASLMKQILGIAYARPERLQQRGGPLLLSLLTEIQALAEDEPPERPAAPLPPQVVQALDAIGTDAGNAMTVDGLAKKVGWSPEHLSRSFVRHLGMTPKEAIIRQRIERACQMLLTGNKSVKEVAFTAGFADENYFSRVFKSVKTVTATEYRAKHYHPKYVDTVPAVQQESLYPPNRVFFGKE